MKTRTHTILVVGTLAATLFSMFATNVSFAESSITLSDNQIGYISQHCASIKQSLRTLQRTDARTRSYLGSAYERALSDYIVPLDLRLINTSQPNVDLTNIHSDIIKVRQDFIREYTTYSQSLEDLIGTDCQNNPEDFYYKLSKTREKRDTLSDTTESLRALLSKHLSAVEKLKNKLGASDE